MLGFILSLCLCQRLLGSTVIVELSEDFLDLVYLYRNLDAIRQILDLIQGVCYLVTPHHGLDLEIFILLLLSLKRSFQLHSILLHRSFLGGWNMINFGRGANWAGCWLRIFAE